jgi:hypothetical protein
MASLALHELRQEGDEEQRHLGLSILASTLCQ